MAKLEELKIKAEEAEEATKAYEKELNKHKVWSPIAPYNYEDISFLYIDTTFKVHRQDRDDYENTKIPYIGDIDALIACGNYFTLDQKELAEKEADRRLESSLMSAYVREFDPSFDLDEAIKNRDQIYCLNECGIEHYPMWSTTNISASKIYMSRKVAEELEEKLLSGEVSFKRVR